ncbi:hypothetical protein RD792_006692 [Penstemon davidsonii]|uniref:PPM-type phosphatase domain-containing protein n=1 Tax=Penstemon davidsonii TaxID=160366 RepID=A0ABR0DD52_9LAMI|nr:hypothetical protein RD792_006692 [Penstemon davidsonii]
MGNGIGKLSLCISGDAGDISRRRNDVAVCLSSNPLDEGLGHSFCYIRPDPLQKIKSLSDDSSSQTTAYRTISGAAISANTSTPLSTTDPFAYNALDKAAAFESSNFFSSIPLQPIPRNSFVKSGPIIRNQVPVSGPIERGFMSGPIERSFISGPLDNNLDHQLQRYRTKSKKWALVKNLKKVFSKSFWGFSKELKSDEIEHNNNVVVSLSNSGNSSTITSNNLSLSSEMSLIDENDDVGIGNESFGSQNVQWAQGKAGEDRVHIVISEEHGWVFVGIYDGFNGPDATDFLMNNLYSNVYKELQGLLWCDKGESCENTVNSSSFMSKSLDNNERVELDRKLREKLSNLGPDGIAGNNNDTVNHLGVLKALSEALRKTEASYLEIADMMLRENPELALMGSCVLAMVMKENDVYLMNVGDSRAVLAQKNEKDSQVGKIRKDYEESLYGYEYENVHSLSSCQLTMDHSTDVKEEVRRIRNAHLDDPLAITNDRVKGSLKVTRAFGAGFLKQPKWNNALLEMFRIDYIGTSPYISCSPSLCHHKLDPVDKFLILSSDGLYQYFTNEEAVSEVEIFMSTFPEGDPAQHLVEEVLFRAAKKAGMDFHELIDIPQGDRRRYHDDVSIIIISFEGRIWRSSV